MIEMYATKIVEACALQAIKDSPLLMALSKADDKPDDMLKKVIDEAEKGDQLCKLIPKGSMAA
jgi:hypothetical protein